MIYTYLQTRGLQYGVDGNWITYKKSKQLVWEFMSPTFFKQAFIQIVASQGTNPQPFWITAAQLTGLPDVINKMIYEVFFEDFPDGTFTPVNNVPNYQIDYVKYYDAQRMEYDIKLSQNTLFVDATGQVPSTRHVPPPYLLAELPDLELTHPRWITNMARIDKTCLVAVNGFFHNTSLNPDSDLSIFAVDGGHTANTSGFRRVSILDFDAAGGFQKFPLSGLTITPDPDTAAYYGQVTVSGVPIDMTNSILALSLGGYLILPSGTSFYRDTANSFKINLQDFSIEKKIVLASQYMDLSALGLASLVPDSVQQDYTILQSNAVLEAFLKLSQSFLIVIPKPDTTVYATPFRRYSDNRSIRTNFEPTALLFSSLGRLVNYWNTDGREGKDEFNRVVFTDFQNDQDQLVSTSPLYPQLLTAYPKLKPAVNDVINQFFSLGYYTPN
jgi:hypothetical protein